MIPILLEKFPPFAPIEKGEKRIQGLSCYLETLLGTYEEDTLQLPCIETMASFFRASHLDILDALQYLRHQGFDYHLQGSHLPIQIWTIRQENKNNKE